MTAGGWEKGEERRRVLAEREWEIEHEERLRYGCRRESWMAQEFVTSTRARAGSLRT